LLEAVGSCAGGLFASLALFLHASAFQIALLVLLVNAGCAVWLIVRRSPRRLVIGGALAAVIAASLAWIVPSLERASQAMMWRGLRPVASVDSPYGRLDVVDTESTRSVYENGLVAFHAEDVASAEEAVHFALLQHPAPKSLLLIGGGMNGSLGRALQHPTLARSDYVELDPTVLSLAERYLPEQFAALRSARVRSHQLDGRLFVKTTGARFDVIIVNLPEPQTAQLNRFYTREFFAEAAEKLNAGGLLALQLRGAENYISPDLGDFLRCIHATLRSVFADTVVIPGETIHLFAANRTGVLTADPQTLLARLRERGIQTQYVREYYLPFRMAPDRMRELESELHSSGAVAINRDLSPAAYYFGVMLWSTSFDARYRQLFAWLAGVKFANVLLVTVVPLAVLAVAMRLRRRRKGIAGLCVGATGLAMMALEVLLLLGFQAIYGYVYHQLAIVIAAFMAGMALGSWLLLRDARSAPSEPVNAWALPALQLAAAISPLLLYAVLRWLTMMSSGGGLLWASQLLFPAMALAFGILGGYQFQVASRVYFAPADGRRPNPAALYAIDLLGAFAGAIVVSAYLVPVFGILKCTCVIAAVALAPALVALPASTTVRRPAPR
jgi:spermidine synthase